MENEQLLKRVDWIDEERRKDKSVIAGLENRVNSLEGSLAAADKLIHELSSELTHLKTILARIDTFEDSITKLRTENNRRMDEIEKNRREQEEKVEELRRVQFEGIHKSVNDIRKELEQFPDIHEQIKLRVDEEARLNRKLDEFQVQIVNVKRDDEEIARTLRLLEEGRRRDDKRLSDLQGESIALRKRADEQRGKLDLAADTLRKVENRLNELATVESERRDSYNAFVEKQTLSQVERDRKWSEWQARFETIEKQTMEFESKMQELHTTNRDVRRAQETVESVSERVERRMNEITEMQRLAEDRFRQEWTTFKADDQKRWTNYTLTQDEQIREANRSQTRVTERITNIEEQVQSVEDTVDQMVEQTETRLQRLLALARDWAAEYEQIFGRAGR